MELKPEETKDSSLMGFLSRVMFSTQEVLLAVSTVIGIVLWAGREFQSKEDAQRQDAEISAMKQDIAALRSGMGQIAIDVSYIRAKVEIIGINKK